MTAIVIAAVLIAVPALAFTLWPLLHCGGGRGLLLLPPDAREQLQDGKRAVLRALRELEFEHSSGHVSDDDYAELRTRYESEAATILTDLDRLGAPAAPARPVSAPRPSAWRHPVALAISAALLVVFGVLIGAGIVRYTAPDPMAGMPQPGSRPLAELTPAPGAPIAPGAPSVGGPGSGSPSRPGSTPEGGAPRVLPPEMLKGMLEAARQSLFAGRLREAATAYQAVLKRDQNNVDALTHVALILAMSADGAERTQLIDHALGLFDRALAIDPNYPPALLYRGQVLYEAKQDVPGAVHSWEKFLAVTPAGEDRDRVAKMIADAKRTGAPR